MAVILTTIENVPGKEIQEILGVVTSSSDGNEKNVDDALKKLGENASKIGANAVIGIRIAITNLRRNNLKLCAYGTAVTI